VTVKSRQIEKNRISFRISKKYLILSNSFKKQIGHPPGRISKVSLWKSADFEHNYLTPDQPDSLSGALA